MRGRKAPYGFLRDFGRTPCWAKSPKKSQERGGPRGVHPTGNGGLCALFAFAHELKHVSGKRSPSSRTRVLQYGKSTGRAGLRARQPNLGDTWRARRPAPPINWFVPDKVKGGRHPPPLRTAYFGRPQGPPLQMMQRVKSGLYQTLSIHGGPRGVHPTGLI
jgi:hypothetical protein